MAAGEVRVAAGVVRAVRQAHQPGPALLCRVLWLTIIDDDDCVSSTAVFKARRPLSLRLSLAVLPSLRLASVLTAVLLSNGRAALIHYLR
jgi:hypothetical protein